VSSVAVVGAGIIGLAAARALTARGDEVTVFEKEQQPARHQTGRNSGVVHSGLYYTPGSLKARMAVAGNRSMLGYARAHGVANERCGKLVVAVEPAEVPGLLRLAQRASANGVPGRLIGPAEAREHEPHVRCVRALRVESTGIVDYVGVCAALAEEVRAGGGEIRLAERLVGADSAGDSIRVRTSSGTRLFDGLLACAGLYSDRVATLSGLAPEARIIPFRGEYFEVAPEKEHLVRGLVYPVPDPAFPFLGVHLTRMVGGGVHAGPNAVMALAREGYRWSDVDLRELAGALSWPGLWRLGARTVVPGARELGRSVSRRAFARRVARLVPGIEAADLVRAPAGVRAQALRRDGSLVDDFLVQTAPRQVHVLNAPSPAATAALEIATHLVASLDRVMRP